jgi:hypothetical protein
MTLFVSQDSSLAESKTTRRIHAGRSVAETTVTGPRRKGLTSLHMILTCKASNHGVSEPHWNMRRPSKNRGMIDQLKGLFVDKRTDEGSTDRSTAERQILLCMRQDSQFGRRALEQTLGRPAVHDK